MELLVLLFDGCNPDRLLLLLSLSLPLSATFPLCVTPGFPMLFVSWRQVEVPDLILAGEFVLVQVQVEVSTAQPAAALEVSVRSGQGAAPVAVTLLAQSAEGKVLQLNTESHTLPVPALAAGTSSASSSGSGLSWPTAAGWWQCWPAPPWCPPVLSSALCSLSCTSAA